MGFRDGRPLRIPGRQVVERNLNAQLVYIPLQRRFHRRIRGACERQPRGRQLSHRGRLFRYASQKIEETQDDFQCNSKKVQYADSFERSAGRRYRRNEPPA